MSYTTPILVGGVPSNQTIRQATTEPRHAPGTFGQLTDGRTFRYASSSSSSALSAGQLCMSEVITSNFTNVAVSAAAAVGTSTVSVTLGGSSSVAVNEYAGGYVVVNDVDGEGRTYAIASNAAISSSTAFTVELAEDIETALTTSSQVVVMKSPWSDVVEAAAGHVHMAAGIPQFEVPAGNTDTQYFWIQTSGITAGEDDAATAIGSMLQSGATAGQIEVGDGTAQNIGVQLTTGVATEHTPKFLKVD